MNEGGWLVSGGEMGALIRARDWSQTPLGPLAAWPQSLRTTVNLCLASNFPINLIWGRGHHTQIINDGYRGACGAKYLQVMGEDYAVSWASAWPAIGEAFHRAWQGETSFLENQRMFLHRNGYLEETFFTFSLSPIRDETGAVAGLFHPVTEVTAKMLSERRSRALRELAARIGKAKETRPVFDLAAQSLESFELDLPFVLFYEQEPGLEEARLVASAGVAPGSPLAPSTLRLDAAGAKAAWPLAAVGRAGGRAVVVEELTRLFGPFVCGPYDEAPKAALLLPITLPGSERPAGVMVAGISARLLFDESYQDFCTLLAATVSAAVANARAYEEEKHRAEALAELDRAKTTFFSNISHELRTPLTLMLGPVEELLREAEQPLPPDVRSGLEVVHRSSLRLLRLVNTLLDFSRIEAKRLEVHLETTDLGRLTSDLASSFRSATEAAGLRLTVAAQDVQAAVDREMWEKIVLNLLSNAFKFTLAGEITVGLSRVGGEVELQVSDTGVGIPANELPRLFERFYRVKGAKGRSFEGTGIGLALVAELVKLHGGRVEVESVDGKGSTFRVVMPAASACEVVTAAADNKPENGHDMRAMFVAEARASAGDTKLQARSGGAGPRILLVDDNADMRTYVARLLAPRFAVETAADGEAAWEALLSFRPDLVLTDVMMPRLDGFGLLARIRADDSLKSLPVILLSARAGEEARIEGLDVGADDYLVKPFGARELLARVNAHVAMARTRAEAFARERELRAEAEAAHRSNRLKDEFLATVSHELRTPLNAVLGFSEILLAEGRECSDFEIAVEAITRNAKLQLHLVDDLLDVSRIVSGKLRLLSAPLKLEDVLRAAAETVRLGALAKNIVLALDLPLQARGVTFVLGDGDRLQQVLWNLLINAVRHTPAGGRITVTLRGEGSQAVVTVRDSGEGIDPAFLPYVFDPLRQEDGSHTRRHGGLGLGLTIVKHLVAAHGGSVEVASPGKGQGTTFTVRLPMAGAAKAAEADRAQAAQRPQLAGVRVLLVDDDGDARKLLEILLKRAGARATVAASAGEAFELLRNDPPDVFVSDLGMPVEDGLSLMHRIRGLSGAEGGRVPALALTAWTRSEDHLSALGAGFQEHLGKPIDAARLITAVARLAGRADAEEGVNRR